MVKGKGSKNPKLLWMSFMEAPLIALRPAQKFVMRKPLLWRCASHAGTTTLPLDRSQGKGLSRQHSRKFTSNFVKGAYMYDIHNMCEFFTPFSPLSTFTTDLCYKIHASSLTTYNCT